MASADLDSWIRTVAASMTSVIRTFVPGTEHSMYNGTGYQLGYDVRWPWIVLPAVLVSMSCLILIAIIAKTAISPVQAWKGSPLAMLFMHADHRLRQGAAGHLEEHGGVEKAIGKNRVALEQDSDGTWTFKHA